LPREVAAPRVLSPQTPPSSALASAHAAVEHAIQNASPAVAPEKALQFARTQQGGEPESPKRSVVGGAEPASPPASGSAPAASYNSGGNASVGFGGGGSAPLNAAPAVVSPTFPTTPRSQEPPVAHAAGPNSCPACGNPVPVDFKFCGTCGHRMPAAAQSAAAAPAAAAVSAKASRGALIVINPDGTEGGVFPLSEGSSSVGRNHSALFAADAYLSPTHATFSLQGATCTVVDENSLNGIYVKLKRDAPVKLNDGDIFRIGQELVRFEVLAGPQFVRGVEPMGSPNPGYVGRLSLVIGRESYGNGYPIPPDGIHLGRERGDVVFPEDGYVSGLHCRVHYDGSGCVLTDVGSSNGTFLRVRGSRQFVAGDLLLMGQQLFRLQC
jgi:pSer/pThr/pTyr-binding forkhead associated (FHA) protein